MQDAFATALERWPRDGIPDEPGAWIIRTARNRAIDVLRRRRMASERERQAVELEALRRAIEPERDSTIPDERLGLMFACCHPLLAPDASVALTLRLVAGPHGRGDRPRAADDAAGDLAAPRALEAHAARRAREHGRPGRSRAARAPRRRARRDLPRLQRGPLRDRRRATRARRAVQRGDPPRARARAADARRERGARPARPLPRDRRAARARYDAAGPYVSLEEHDRSLLRRGEGRRGRRAGARHARAGPGARTRSRPRSRAAHARADLRRDRLGADRRALRPARALRSLAGDRAQPRHRGVACGETGGRAAAARRARGAARRLRAVPRGVRRCRATSGDDAAARKAYERALALTGNPGEREFLERRLRELA